MGFTQKLKYFLIKSLSISNKEVNQLLYEGKVLLNGKVTRDNPVVFPEDELICNGVLVKKTAELLYFAYYKPMGIECTMNPEIPDNLLTHLPVEGTFPVGRLDKASEGLLLLTNDGRIYDRILRKEEEVEKIYEVKVNQILTDDFLYQMSAGVKIMGKMTDPCELRMLTEDTFEIKLKEGRNRQIRRMCYKLGYEVLNLRRVAIGKLNLGELKEGEWRQVSLNEIL